MFHPLHQLWMMTRIGKVDLICILKNNIKNLEIFFHGITDSKLDILNNGFLSKMELQLIKDVTDHVKFFFEIDSTRPLLGTIVKQETNKGGKEDRDCSSHFPKQNSIQFQTHMFCV